MSISDQILPIVKGGLFFFVFLWVGYIIWWALKHTGILQYIKKTKIPDKVYQEVAGYINEDKEWGEIAQVFSKYDKKVQDQYIKAYLELKKIEQEQLKGGKIKNEKRRKESPTK